jgi:O-succinylbenzoic acid--CoA ligase
MTETCSHIALRRFNGTEKSDCFTILDGVTIRQDERECLTIKAPHLLDVEIQTNDMVELIGSQSFRWLGRVDSTINSGGVKVHPEQVEKKLEGLIPSSYFVSSLPDELLGRKVVLVIKSEAYSLENEATLIDKMKLRLDKYELPKQILYLPTFIYSQSNKILRTDSLQKALDLL